MWLIPLEHFDTVVNYLDEREKGGYSRSIIDVQLNEDTMIHNSGATIQALVYIGQSDNPNFYLPQRDLYASVEIIAAAEGPSGANSDYLLNLVSFLGNVCIQLSCKVSATIQKMIFNLNRSEKHERSLLDFAGK